MASTGSGKVLIYKSANMVERRKRILNTARAMIAEDGYENFSIRELTRRAGVAQRTLYNAFGSKENIISTAITEYQNEFDERTVLHYPVDSLERRLEQAVIIVNYHLLYRPYVTAIMAIYNSQSAHPSIRGGFRKLSFDYHWPYAQSLAANRQLADHISAADFIERLTSALYGTLTDWVMGSIPDDKMVARMVESLLTVALACTQGKAQSHAAGWLADVRDNAPRWRELLKQVERPAMARRTPPAPRARAQPAK